MNKDHKRDESSITKRKKEKPPEDEPVKEVKKKTEFISRISNKMVCFMLGIVLLFALVYIVQREGSFTSPLKHCCPCEPDERSLLNPCSPSRPEERVPTEPNEPQNEEISIFVMGKLSTGKSTLTYGLLGLSDKEMKEKLGFTSAEISMNNIDARDVRVKIFMWSLPEDVENLPEPEDSIVAQIRSVDLVLFTIRMDDVRFRPPDKTALRKLGQTFGSTIWEKTVIALTHANKVSDIDKVTGEEIESKTFFDSKRAKWANNIHAILKEEEVPHNVICSIPILPAGYYHEPIIYNESWRDIMISGLMSRVREDTQGIMKRAFNLENHVNIPASFCQDTN